MGRFNDISQIYDAELLKLHNPQYWESTLKRTAAFWRLSFVEAILLTAQKPKATMVASYDQWNMAGRRINRGEHSVAVFKNRNDTVIRCLFDITQTNGKEITRKWQMSDDLADALTAMFNATENSEVYTSLEDYIQSSVDNSLYAKNSLQSDIEKNAMLADFVRKSAECICLTRCGIVRNYDFSDAAKFADDISIVQIGNAATGIAQSVLQPIETAIRRKQYEPYRNTDNRNRYRLYREGRSIFPGFSQLRTEGYDAPREKSGRPAGRNRPVGTGYDEHERTISAHMEGDRSESGSRALTDGRTSTETNITQQELTGASSTARSNTASSRTGSVGNSENVRELAVTRDTFPQNAVRGGKDTSGNDELNPDSEEDWIHSSEYEEYAKLNEQIEYSEDSGYNKEAADENVASFFVDNDDSSEQVSRYDDKAVEKETHQLTFDNEAVERVAYSTITDDEQADKLPSITCNWSESAAFEDGKTYSVAEFDSIMAKADKAKQDGRAAELEKYGSEENWRELNEESYYKYLGYDKTKFTVNLPNGSSVTERQDIGDGYGGVIEFLAQYSQYTDLAEQLRNAAQAEIAEGIFIPEQGEIPDNSEERATYSTTPTERKPNEPQNYHFPTDFAYPTGAKAKYNANVTAIKTLKQIEAQHRTATPDEQQILAQYSGWGGISDAFDETKENWSKEFAELRELLTPKEYAAAKESTLTAFYTEPYIIKSIFKALEKFGFKGGDILEPSAGTGNFWGNMPAEMMTNSRLHSVELDSITARIAQQLYPEADIQNKGFERTKFENGTFDVVVGNVPFGDFSPYAKEYNDYLIHDYFFVKSLDKLKAGGIMALITSSGTMDKRDNSLRAELYRKADFIGGIRLPDDAFKTAGTKTVTDILFFQKLEKQRLPSSDWENVPFLNVNYISEKFRGGYYENRYFTLNKDMVLGQHKMTSGRFGYGDTIVSDGNTEEKLLSAIEKLDCTFSAVPTYVDELPSAEDNKEIPDGVTPYTYYIVDDKLYYAENRSETEIDKSNKYYERIKAICDVFGKYDKVFKAQQRNCSDAELLQLQAELSDVYDEFVARYGYLSSKSNTRAFDDDMRLPGLSAIETMQEDTDGNIIYKKSDIFTQRVVNTKRQPTHADTALEALHIALNLRQTVDLEYMSELCGRDKDSIIYELGDRIYCNPAKNAGGKYSGWETAEEYLSGYVRKKLALAQEAAQINPDFERNVSALLENQPEKIDITNISFRLGTIYIPVDYVQQFMYETFETPQWKRCRNGEFKKDSVGVLYVDEINEWKIPTAGSSSHNSVLETQTYGTSRLNAYELLQLTLNQKRAEINDYVENSDGKVRKVFNAKETILARECQDKIEQAFHDWIMADKLRIETIERIYNENYNNIKTRAFDGSYIEIDGMNPNLSLRPHQKNVIARIAATGTCMMAHEVGAGKTAAMAAAGMYLKSIGVCHKPMYVVPNAVVGQFAAEFQRFFPEAKIIAATPQDMAAVQRRRFLSKISAGNYDAVIIPSSQFESMPLSLERQEEMYEEKISEVSLAIQSAKTNQGERLTVKALEGQRKKLEKKIEKLRASFKKDDFITFEELGCDFLFVDEAHHYKNLAVFSKMSNVAGVSTSQNSQQAFDMEMKCRYLQKLHNGGGVVFATGTPISNSITELFVWQYLLQKPKLEDMNISYFDNWASVFGNIGQAIEIKPSGDGFRMRTRFENLNNLPELCNIFGDVFDIAKTADMNLDLPEIAGKKPEMIICEKSPEQEQQTEYGIERARKIEAGLVTNKQDNMLSVCTYMSKVALDARIIDPEAEEFDGGKVAQCADRIIEIHKDNPTMAQTVFCDTNTPKADGFSVYKALKERLLRSGIFSENEIAFVHNATNDQQRLELFDKVNNAEIKVIIGSTEKLGTGVNIQRRLAAMHHLDAPYRPSDVEHTERNNGRPIVRQDSSFFIYSNSYV